MKHDNNTGVGKILSSRRSVTGGGNIEIDEAQGVHRIVTRMPEFYKDFGLWIMHGLLEHKTEVDSFFSRHLRRFDFYSVSHMYAGFGTLELNGCVYDVQPGDMVVICPGDDHRYGGSGGKSYCEDAVCFCGNMADAMYKKGILRSGLYHASPIRVLKPMIESARDPALVASLRAAIQLQELLLELFSRREVDADPMQNLLNTIHSAPQDHWWRVTELAELMGVSTDTLRREFLRVTGLLPKNYIERFKLRQAAEMLLTENCPVRVVAARFGYLDAFHFSRRFKHIHGLSPENFRVLACAAYGKAAALR